MDRDGDWMTPCNCKVAGWCPIHRFTMTEREFELCQTRLDYFHFFATGDTPQHRRELVDPPRPVAPHVTAEQLPCPFRGPVLRQIGCGQCGDVERMMDIFACLHFAECTLNRAGLKTPEQRQLASCLGCDIREDPA